MQDLDFEMAKNFLFLKELKRLELSVIVIIHYKRCAINLNQN